MVRMNRYTLWHIDSSTFNPTNTAVLTFKLAYIPWLRLSLEPVGITSIYPYHEYNAVWSLEYSLLPRYGPPFIEANSEGELYLTPSPLKSIRS